MRNLGLVYSIVESERKDYLIDHSASIVLISPEGKLVAMFRPKVAPGEVPHVDMQTMVSDFARIVRLADSEPPAPIVPSLMPPWLRDPRRHRAVFALALPMVFSNVTTPCSAWWTPG